MCRDALRIPVKVSRLTDLYNAPQVHYRHAIADVLYQREVVRDEHVGQPLESDEIDARIVDDALGLIWQHRDVRVDVLDEQLGLQRRLVRNDPVDVAIEEWATTQVLRKRVIGLKDPASWVVCETKTKGPFPTGHWLP